MDGLTLQFPIVKIDASRREVWGYATTEDLDQQGEVVRYDASKAAFEEWSRMMSEATKDRGPEGQSLGNIREMHGPKTVGKAIAVQYDDKRKGIWLGAKLSESSDGEDAWLKVQEGILNGFSIGAPVADRALDYVPGVDHPVQVVTSFKLAEVSLVDNPACPGSFFKEIKLAKASGPTSVLGSIDSDASPRGATVVRKGGEERAKSEPKAAAVAARPLSTKEATMSQTIEKAGRKIGPQEHGGGKSPGEQTPKVPSPEAAPEAPKPAKSAEAGAHDDATHPMGSVPDGQGKAAEAEADAAFPPAPPGAPHVPPPAAPAAPSAPPMAHTEPDGDEPVGMHPPTAAKDPGMNPMRYAFCAYCGTKMADADSGSPFHKDCAATAEMKQAAAGLNLGKVAGMFKAFGAEIEKVDGAVKAQDGKIAAQGRVIADLQKRIKTIEDTPLPGGPFRTELPDGVKPVEKGAAPPSKEAEAAILEKAMSMVTDPFTRDRISRELAKRGIKEAQTGR